jgi:hypothetical protein
LQHATLVSFFCRCLCPFLIAKLVGDFAISLNDLVTTDLVQILHCRWLEFDPMAIRVDHRMVQLRVNFCRFSGMIA